MSENQQLIEMTSEAARLAGGAYAMSSALMGVQTVLVAILVPALPLLAARGFLTRDQLLQAYSIAEQQLSSPTLHEDARDTVALLHSQLAFAMQYAQ